jgi:hypothetical protein
MEIFGTCCQASASRPAQMKVITSNPKPPAENFEDFKMNVWTALGNHPEAGAADGHVRAREDDNNLIGKSCELASNDLAMPSVSESLSCS